MNEQNNKKTLNSFYGRKVEFTLHDLGAAFCNFNQKCFAACAECAAFINGFCGGDPSAADLEEIGEEIVKEWKAEIMKK